MRARNTVFVLLGVLGLLLKRWFAGGRAGLIHSYAGNVSASFAVYFLALNAVALVPSAGTGLWPRLLAAASAFAAVASFEATNGFGVMSNTFDPWDFLANAAGIGLGVVADLASHRWARPGDRPATGRAD